MTDPVIIVGGGISGVSCASTLAQLDPALPIKLISCSPTLKVITNVQEKGNYLTSFDVTEKPSDQLSQQYSNIEVISDTVISLDAAKKTIHLAKNNDQLKYSKLCICTGARPKLIDTNFPDHLIGIRDTSTVKDFEKRLLGASRVVVVGNGGIATELVYSIEFCQIIWAIKDSSFGSTFLDPGAAQFFTQYLKKEKRSKETIIKRIKYSQGAEPGTSNDDSGKYLQNLYGSALGPDWSDNIEMKGASKEMRSIEIEYNCEVNQIYFKKDLPLSKYQFIVFEEEVSQSGDLKWPIYVELNNGKIYGSDLIISATGVIPNVEPFLEGNNFKVGSDLGLSVNDQMLTTESDVYAAGDVCSADWQLAPHWFQMRLWTQARQMGIYSAYCITSHIQKTDPSLYFPFELFTHMTSFFGFKVVLLGLYLGQKLDSQYQILLRIKDGDEYVKVIMKDGHMQGALLIGETDLEETFENLIINQLDLTDIQDDLLNPTVDIEDYFD
ncbi:pyridine nucleotide-disulfide oxidoreductase domain-containing protein 1-like [Tetranychus urticae]|uniref:Pyridine nucleotide-disulfide oxidoreductase domain-containing protein 1 n=1 Tax=Tetranychus urticae TaxID=32264 RepID=T1K3K7_TETUR|nr:pyridine nucleotide-disulfide oxidoreductase domain-containing protein 1-like [Tetranychus urticae]